MLEAVIFLGVAIALLAGGLAVWRLARGPARRRWGVVWRAAALGVLIAAAMLFGAWKLSNAHTFQLFGGLVDRVETEAPVVALTFDDGPTAQFTAEVLEVLGQRQVKATFFVVGEALERNPELGRQIVAAGHELGNHSYSHTRLILQPLSLIRQEIEDTDRLIRQAGHEGEIHFRPPNGKKLILLPYYLAGTGRKTITWTVALESAPDTADLIAARVLEQAQPGSIILLHVMYESRAESRAALPAIIDGLQAKGYRFVTVSELLAANGADK
jgi:peptidoglycan/xylan/chitin deacetylase (PgdA/CDA1 family)